MPASRLRLENSSLFHYIKDQVIPIEFSEQRIKESLVYNSTLNAFVASAPGSPSPVSDGRGWVYFDDSIVNGRLVVDITQEQTSKVSVYTAGDVLIDPSNYTVNYKNGSIIRNSGDEPAKVSYYWNYVSVLPSWPGTVPPPLPLVSLGIDFSEKEGFQLGPGVRNVRTIYFNIFCTSPQERDDLSELIHNSIHDRRIDILDFSSGDYIESKTGTFNDSVVPLSSLGSMFFFETSHRNMYVADDFSDLYKYRSVITGIYESFVEDSSS